MSAATGNERWRMSATELAWAIRTKEATSQEVVEAHLRRIEAVNPSINALVVVLAGEALEAARVADRAVADGVELPPLHGVPFTVKENLDVAGTPTTQGLAALADAFPARDAPIVERLRAAGAILIGRTNMPSGAIRWHCESELWGTTLNPWDATRTPGASSAGEAAAIATGMSPLGLGNDGLGSLRHPAQCCGIAALKPSLGRVPQASSIGLGDITPIGIQLTSVNGPLARRVADLRTAFETHRRSHVARSLDGTRAAPGSAAPDTHPCGRRPGSSRPRNRKTGAGRCPPRGRRPAPTPATSSRSWNRRASKRRRGSCSSCSVRRASDSVGSSQRGRSCLRPPSRFMSAFFEAAGEPDATVTEQAFIGRFALLRAWGEFQVTHPLILAPIATEPPRVAGTDLDDGQVAEDIRTMRMAMAVNALGLPAVAVPVGVAEGLPQAVQVIGPRYREDLCLDAAGVIEERLGIITPIEPG